MDDTNKKVTLVTAYFDIGEFQKGPKESKTQGPNNYMNWMKAFSKIDNPVVVFLDDDKYVDMLKNIRGESLSSQTQIIKVTRDDLWAFKLKPDISKIFSDPTYPKYHPYTVVPDYACIVCAKYETMAKAIDANYFGTDYFAWIDIGYWRDEVSSNTPNFHIGLPPGFDESRISYGAVSEKQNVSSELIFLDKVDWLAGGFFIGHKKQMMLWVRNYMQYAEICIKKRNLMGEDQQVIYAMLNDESFKRDVDLQVYGPVARKPGQDADNQWFHLGYLCRKFSE